MSEVGPPVIVRERESVVKSKANSNGLKLENQPYVFCILHRHNQSRSSVSTRTCVLSALHRHISRCPHLKTRTPARERNRGESNRSTTDALSLIHSTTCLQPLFCLGKKKKTQNSKKLKFFYICVCIYI